jgi:hypothetical protein
MAHFPGWPRGLLFAWEGEVGDWPIHDRLAQATRVPTTSAYLHADKLEFEHESRVAGVCAVVLQPGVPQVVVDQYHSSWLRESGEAAQGWPTQCLAVL